MKSTALISLAALCALYSTPIESAHWGVAKSGNKLYVAAPATDNKLNWWNAYKLCRQQGMELASIESQAEMDVVNSLLMDVGGGANIFYFLSGSDLGRTTNSFVWFSNGRPVKGYTNWNNDHGDPNNATDEDYMFMGHNRGKYVWGDGFITTPAAALCELDLTDASIGRGNKPTYYVDLNTKLNWYEAARACAQRGMRLASVESQSELDQLTALVKATRVGTYDELWSSATDMGQTAKSYFWFSTGNPVSFTAWGDSQPNGGSEHCLVVVVPSSGNSSWHDWSCTTEKNFACEVRHD